MTASLTIIEVSCQRVGSLDVRGMSACVLRNDVILGGPCSCQAAQLLVEKGQKTHVLASASKISCASLVTPFPFVASRSLIFLIAAVSRAFNAFRSTREMDCWASSGFVVAGSERTSMDWMRDTGMRW